jgi:kynurenine formamidase
MIGMSPYSLCLWTHPFTSRRELEAEGARNEVGFADERVEMDLHTGTHIDSLGHCWIGETGFNQRSMPDTVGNRGLKELGIDQVPPLLGRGVLVDLVQASGRPLEAGAVIAPSDLEAAMRLQGTHIEAGDMVLIRSGWGRYYGRDNGKYASTFPGIGVDAAIWLADHRVSLVASDTMALEVYPPESEEAPWAVHQLLLARFGIYILENAYLEEVASSTHYEFLCVCLPIKFQGGTASPVRLIAVV